MTEHENLGHLPSGLWSKDVDPLDTYFDQFRQGARIGRHKWIVSPDWAPCRVNGTEAIAEWFECHALPRFWQLLTDIWQKFQCGTYFIKSPNWIEPPITAVSIDCRNETAVPLS